MPADPTKIILSAFKLPALLLSYHCRFVTGGTVAPVLKTKAEGKYGQTMRPRWLTLFLVAGLAAGAGYYYWQQSTPSKLDIQTVAAKKGDVRRVVSTSGTVRELISVNMGSTLYSNTCEDNVEDTTEL